ncbi:MAG: cupin domain-containing protein, partial [Halobacteriales archaeon]|nr:cupin domain-containing protein [Halobacteriales archaeon]
MTDVIPAAEVEDGLEDPMPRDYRRFREEEGVPVHTGLSVEDVTELAVGHWDRTGQRGAYVNLYGTGGLNDLQVHELAPGSETSLQHHLFEEIVYVASGRGATVVGTGDDEVSFEWSAGSLFFLPPSTPYRHVNVAGDAPA